MTQPPLLNMHGTTILCGGVGVMIRGRPGSGKSELALRLIDAPGYGGGNGLLRATLVADDQAYLSLRDGEVWVTCPPALAGLIEVRGIGLLRLPSLAETRLSLIVDLVAPGTAERMPEAAAETVSLLGVHLRRIVVEQGQPAAPAIVRTIVSQFETVALYP